MSGYLEVKYPFRSNLGLNPFKSWKRQWCILRPSPTCLGGGSLAVYCSEAGAPAGTVEFPAGCVVRRAKSRSRPHAFAVFTVEEPRKPRILLAAQTLGDTQVWMEKIRGVLDGNKLLGTENLLKETYSVRIVATELSCKCGLDCDSVITLTASGLHVSRQQRPSIIIDWKHVNDVLLISDNVDKNRTCILIIDSDFCNGPGELKVSSALAGELAAAVRSSLPVGGRKLSKSEGDLRSQPDPEMGEVRRSSWYSGPSEVSLDDIDLIMSKDSKRIPLGQLSRCSGEGDLAPSTPRTAQRRAERDNSMSDRRSLLSIASGIYEEIPDVPADANTEKGTDTVDGADAAYCEMRGPAGLGLAGSAGRGLPEPTYESVAECVYATMRRGKRFPPPPLPPRLPFGCMKLGESWNSRMNVPGGAGARCARHGSLGSLGPVGPLGTLGSPGSLGAAGAPPGSLGSLPRCCSVSSRTDPLQTAKSLPKFSVFRKRLKSDSRIASSPKSETLKENKDIETKKKRFDFTPTRDIFKSFKVSRKMKNLKITSGLAKGETKSCEYLDETEHVTSNRCSKSVECLEDEDFDDFDHDLSIEFNDDAVATLALPQEIVDLILRGREFNKIRLKEVAEGEYMPMSPAGPPIEAHYMVMSPRGHLA